MATTNFVDGVTGLFAPWHNDVDQAVYRSKDYAIDTGIVNAYIVALNPVKTAYTSGMAVVFSTANANTGPATINVNGLGIIPITAQGNVPLTSGQILSNSPMVGIINSSGGNHLEILASNNAAWNDLRYATLASLSTQAFAGPVSFPSSLNGTSNYDAATAQTFSPAFLGDLNTAIQAGDYNFVPSSANKPAGITSYGFLKVFRHVNTGPSAVYVVQLAYDMNGANPNAAFTRRGMSAGTGSYTVTWGSWVAVGAGVGVWQTWQNVLASRVPGVTYTNSTGKPIVVAITAYQTNNVDGSGTLVVGGVSVGYHRNFVNASQPAITQISAIVPDGGNYIYIVGGTNTVLYWVELS
jgi:hypothetical protein